GNSHSVRDFLLAQRVNQDLPVDTSWLLVGHVDEVFSAAPDARHVVVADPAVAWGLLLWAKSIDGTAKMLQNLVGGNKSVNYLLSNDSLRNANFNDFTNADKEIGAM